MHGFRKTTAPTPSDHNILSKGERRTLRGELVRVAAGQRRKAIPLHPQTDGCKTTELNSILAKERGTPLENQRTIMLRAEVT